jgi:hypothetical protein
MDFILHSLSGAALMLAISGAPLPIVYGLLMGGLPDTLDWLLFKIFKTPRWAVYTWFHGTRMGFLVSVLLIVPALHLIFDRLSHPPLLARKGENSYMDEVLIERPIKLTRHDLFWLEGELLLLLTTIILIGIYLI